MHKMSPDGPYVFIAQSAWKVIEEETLRYREQGLETGGILVGKRLSDREILIVGATGAGPNADHHIHTFAPDADYANQELVRLRQKYKDVDYVGLWHKHPPDLDRPSGGDARQAQAILRDTENYKVNGELVTPIVVVRGNEIVFKPYYIMSHFNEFLFIEHEVIPDTDPLVESFRRRAELRFADWVDQGHAARLQADYEELSDLDEVLEIDFNVLEEEKAHIFTVRYVGSPEIKIFLLCDSETYPQSPPEVFVEKEGEEMGAAATLIEGWTAEKPLALVGVVRELLATHLPSEEPQVPTPQHSPPVRQPTPAPSRRSDPSQEVERDVTANGLSRITPPTIFVALAVVGVLLICALSALLANRLGVVEMFSPATSIPTSVSADSNASEGGLDSGLLPSVEHDGSSSSEPVESPTVEDALATDPLAEPVNSDLQTPDGPRLTVHSDVVFIKISLSGSSSDRGVFTATFAVVSRGARELIVNDAGFHVYVNDEDTGCIQQGFFETPSGEKQATVTLRKEHMDKLVVKTTAYWEEDLSEDPAAHPDLGACLSDRGIPRDAIISVRPFIQLAGGEEIVAEDIYLVQWKTE